MKTNYGKLLFLIVICLIGTVVSCYQDNSTSLSEDSLQQFDDFKIYGEVHNELLSYAYENFILTKSVTKVDEAIESLANFQKSYVDRLSIDEEAKSILKKGFDEYKEYYITERVYKKAFLATKSMPEGIVKSDIQQFYENDLIDKFEYECLLIICNATMANYEGSLSIEEFKKTIDELIIKWKEQKYSQDSQYGKVLATILSVSQSSLEWWSENEEALPVTKALPVWAAVDIGGALIGATSNLTYQLCNKDSFNWKSLGWNTVSGAAVGSTGLPGRIGRWISGLF